MNEISKLAVEAFLAVGGAGLIIREIRQNSGAAINLAFDQIEKNPAIKAFLISHRQEIEDLFDAIDQAAKVRLESDANPPPAK